MTTTKRVWTPIAFLIGGTIAVTQTQTDANAQAVKNETRAASTTR